MTIGIVLVTFGVLLLLRNLQVFHGDVWSTALKLWPLLLIGWGMNRLLGHEKKKRMMGLGLFLLGSVTLIGWILWQASRFDPVAFSEPTRDETEARLSIQAQFSQLELMALDDPKKLLSGSFTGTSEGRIPYSRRRIGREAVVEIRPNSMLEASLSRTLAMEMNLALNNRVPWSIRIDLGVGSAVLDLQDLWLQNLLVECTVGRVSLILPKKGKLQAQLRCPLSDLEILVPTETPVSIRLESELSDLDVDPRFSRRGSNLYFNTQSVETSSHFIDLTVESLLGRIRVSPLPLEDSSLGKP